MAETIRRHRPFALATGLTAALFAAPIVCRAAPPQDRAAATSGASKQIAVRSQFQRSHEFKVAIIPSRSGKPLPDDQQIRLYASVDRGRTWRFVEAASTKATAFSVNVPSDGDFLFAVRAVPRDERDQPGATYTPSYRAVVDTESPKLELTARRAASGEIVAYWRASDRNLDQASIQLFAGFGEDLKSVAVETRPGNDPTLFTGTTSWWPSAETGMLTVRGRITDLAGNPAVVSVQVPLAQVETPRDANRDGAGFDEPVSNPRSANERGANDQRAPDREGPSAQEASLRSADGEPAGDAPDSAANDSRPPLSIQRFTPPAAPVAGEPQPWQADSTTGQSLERRVDRGRNEAKPPGIHQPSNAPVEELPSASTIQPPVTRQVGPPESDAKADATPSTHARMRESPTGIPRPRVVGSRRVSLRYDVAGGGAAADPGSGIEVGLWSTRDGGHTWSSHGIDPDNRSPFNTTLDGEGIYGFRITVRGRKQQSSAAPTAGEPADMWVIVDETKPTAAITAAQLETSERGRELLIRYEAADAHLAARPINLFYSDRPGGPWKTIGAGLANAGSHRWPVDARLDEQIYLRIEVQDEAGHIGSFETANPVRLDANAPAGRVEGVESPAAGSARAAWPRYR
jgi:hypothetical protein